MSRWPLAAMLAAMLAGGAGAQQTPSPQLPPDEDAPAKPAPKAAPQAPAGKGQTSTDLPPDEDASSVPTEKVAFNPVKSKKAVAVGDFYFHKGDFKAAAMRFQEATQYNDANAEAWLRLGEAEEKRESPVAARSAYEKYLQLSPNAKNSGEIKKRLEKLK